MVNFNWYECSASFMQGQVAIYMDGVNFASQFEDAAKSKVVGKVGYAVLPSGPGGHFSPIYITGMAVSSQSRNKEAAYLFAQWATNKTNVVRELMAGVGVGRTSTWDNPEVKAKPKMPADWYQAYQASLKIGRQGLPEIVAVTEYRDIIGVAIQKAIEGAPAAQVLAQAQKDFQDMLNRTETIASSRGPRLSHEVEPRTPAGPIADVCAVDRRMPLADAVRSTRHARQSTGRCRAGCFRRRPCCWSRSSSSTRSSIRGG